MNCMVLWPRMVGRRQEFEVAVMHMIASYCMTFFGKRQELKMVVLRRPIFCNNRMKQTWILGSLSTGISGTVTLPSKLLKGQPIADAKQMATPRPQFDRPAGFALDCPVKYRLLIRPALLLLSASLPAVAEEYSPIDASN